jgi:molybdate transport system permease protein
MLDPQALQAIWLTLRLATITTILLLLIGTPIAWWLAQTQNKLKVPVSALVALPIVLPPSVLGFYLLLAMGPNGLVGKLTESLGLGLLPFTFWGLVVASVFYSLPFMVQPLQNAFEAIGRRPLEVAASLGASPVDYVEAMEYAQAHHLSLIMLVFSFIVLMALQIWRVQPLKEQGRG